MSDGKTVWRAPYAGTIKVIDGKLMFLGDEGQPPVPIEFDVTSGPPMTAEITLDAPSDFWTEEWSAEDTAIICSDDPPQLKINRIKSRRVTLAG